MIGFFLCIARCDEDPDDFWDSIDDDDEEIMIDSNPPNLYAKARFNLPVKRRLKLFPEIAKIAQSLNGISNIEFLYEERTPRLIFLDSSDVVVDEFDISKMNQDEVLAQLNLRGFALLSEEKHTPPPMPPLSSLLGNETEANNNSQEINTTDMNESQPEL